MRVDGSTNYLATLGKRKLRGNKRMKEKEEQGRSRNLSLTQFDS